MHVGEAGVGRGMGAGLDNEYDDDDDEHEPCSKKIMPALFAWFLLVSASSAYFTLVLPEFINLLGLGRIHYFISGATLHVLIFLFVILNFSIATFMDPGRFPKLDIHDSIEEEGIHQSGTYKNVLINDINVRMKWCSTCQFYRPPRSSHCGVCNACIDWVCNCIARRNYKYFLLFLISLSTHMLIILALCLTLVLFNKENLSHLPVIIGIVLILISGVLIIPIGGLTGFHLILVTRGRTTNEQVTGKFRTGVNPFDKGCWHNWKEVLCSSNIPSYMKFRRKRLQQREYLEAKIILSKAQAFKDSKYAAETHCKYKKNELNGNHNLNANSNNLMHSSNQVNSQKASKTANSNNEGQLFTFENERGSNGKKRKQPPASANKKQLKPHNNQIYNQNQNQNRASNLSRPKQISDANTLARDSSEYENGANLAHQANSYLGCESKSKQDGCSSSSKRGKHQQQQHQQQHEHLLGQHSHSVWVDRKAGNKKPAKNDEETSKQKKKYINHYENSSMIVKKLQPNEAGELNSKSNRCNKNAINKIMSNDNSQQFASLVNAEFASGSSASGSNRCIRNNSYLNANHNMCAINNLPIQSYFPSNGSSASFATNSEMRPPSSISVTSSLLNSNANTNTNLISNPAKSNNKNNNNKKKNAHKTNGAAVKEAARLQHVQLNMIEENASKKHNYPADYASYEITV